MHRSTDDLVEDYLSKANPSLPFTSTDKDDEEPSAEPGEAMAGPGKVESKGAPAKLPPPSIHESSANLDAALSKISHLGEKGFRSLHPGTQQELLDAGFIDANGYLTAQGHQEVSKYFAQHAGNPKLGPEAQQHAASRQQAHAESATQGEGAHEHWKAKQVELKGGNSGPEGTGNMPPNSMSGGPGMTPNAPPMAGKPPMPPVGQTPVQGAPSGSALAGVAGHPGNPGQQLPRQPAPGAKVPVSLSAPNQAPENMPPNEGAPTARGMVGKPPMMPGKPGQGMQPPQAMQMQKPGMPGQPMPAAGQPGVPPKKPMPPQFQKSGLDSLGDYLEKAMGGEREGHKYIKREGAPGYYKYTYAMSGQGDNSSQSEQHRSEAEYHANSAHNVAQFQPNSDMVRYHEHMSAGHEHMLEGRGHAAAGAGKEANPHFAAATKEFNAAHRVGGKTGPVGGAKIEASKWATAAQQAAGGGGKEPPEGPEDHGKAAEAHQAQAQQAHTDWQRLTLDGKKRSDPEVLAASSKAQHHHAMADYHLGMKFANETDDPKEKAAHKNFATQRQLEAIGHAKDMDVQEDLKTRGQAARPGEDMPSIAERAKQQYAGWKGHVEKPQVGTAKDEYKEMDTAKLKERAEVDPTAKMVLRHRLMREEAKAKQAQTEKPAAAGGGITTELLHGTHGPLKDLMHKQTYLQAHQAAVRSGQDFASAIHAGKGVGGIGQTLQEKHQRHLDKLKGIVGKHGYDVRTAALAGVAGEVSQYAAGLKAGKQTPSAAKESGKDLKYQVGDHTLLISSNPDGTADWAHRLPNGAHAATGKTKNLESAHIAAHNAMVAYDKDQKNAKEVKVPNYGDMHSPNEPTEESVSALERDIGKLKEPASSGADKYQTALAHDKAWSAELQKQFGKEAGDKRYTKEGMGEPGSKLRQLHDQAMQSTSAWQQHMKTGSAPTSGIMPTFPTGSGTGVTAEGAKEVKADREKRLSEAKEIIARGDKKAQAQEAGTFSVHKRTPNEIGPVSTGPGSMHGFKTQVEAKKHAADWRARFPGGRTVVEEHAGAKKSPKPAQGDLFKIGHTSGGKPIYERGNYYTPDAIARSAPPKDDLEASRPQAAQHYRQAYNSYLQARAKTSAMPKPRLGQPISAALSDAWAEQSKHGVALQNAHEKAFPGMFTKKSMSGISELGDYLRKSAEQIPGGLAEGKPDSAFDAKALAQGQKVEMEHTNNPKVAREICKDHLTEDPHYYTKLAKMEHKEVRKAMQKSGLNELGDYLEKSAVKSGDGMPAKGDWDDIDKPAEQTLGESANGGDLTERGSTPGNGTSGPGEGQDKQGQLTGVPEGQHETLGDDREPASQLTAGESAIEEAIPEGQKSMTPAGQRQMVAREHAQKVAELTKSNDVQVGFVHPLSNQTIHGNTDAEAEALLKSDFYYGASPTLAQPGSMLRQTVLCKSENCGCKYPAMLTSCPSCGEGITKSRMLPRSGYMGGGDAVILEKSSPLIRPARVEADVCIPGPSPVLYRQR